VLRLLLGFSMMSVVSGVVAPLLQLFVRSKLLHSFDATAAGLWQANIRLSDYYLNFVYTVMGVYYLPRLSSLKGKEEIRKEIFLGYKRILPIVIVATLSIWFLRDYILTYLLSKEFTGMLLLLKWQLIGDVIKISSWILGYVVVAKAMKRFFVATEIIFAILFVILSYWLINIYGVIGAVYGFVLNYTLYLLTLIVFLRNYLR
jgi:PST family polysaccharide transporter